MESSDPTTEISDPSTETSDPSTETSDPSTEISDPSTETSVSSDPFSSEPVDPSSHSSRPMAIQDARVDDLPPAPSGPVAHKIRTSISESTKRAMIELMQREAKETGAISVATMQRVMTNIQLEARNRGVTISEITAGVEMRQIVREALARGGAPYTPPQRRDSREIW